MLTSSWAHDTHCHDIVVRYWISYFLSHWALFVLSWTASYFIMLVAGMDGVSQNNALCYFVLALSAGVTFIVFGYMLSFATDDIMAAQQWITELLAGIVNTTADPVFLLQTEYPIRRVF